MCVRERAYELVPFYGAGALTHITKQLLTDIIAAAAAGGPGFPASSCLAWLEVDSGETRCVQRTPSVGSNLGRDRVLV